METRVKTLRTETRDLVKEFNKTEDDLKALQVQYDVCSYFRPTAFFFCLTTMLRFPYRVVHRILTYYESKHRGHSRDVRRGFYCRRYYKLYLCRSNL